MDYIDVTSSNVSAVAYEKATSTLGIRFRNGTEYHYTGVPEAIFKELLSADSVGKYVNKFVREKAYPYKRIN